ncbi:tagaturonate reductase [Parapedobacter sp. 10938]|uniref:tagaturonate reductase n=1 Tax=Parapedobacter flavus TaxID=3110225 RepID=UPI002DB5D3A8|nr:tagaturonate reductase [Parapedobacter sp. 10938]MEC3878864.1 tagaturonate reductase [Parapedobacter sp. 10938]
MELLNRQFVEAETHPEKVLQFGTGVLLRGLPDYFIEKANQAGLFGGRIAVVKSTDRCNIDPFEQQDNLYTIHIKGVERGRDVQEVLLVSAISRVIPAASEWETVLDSARNPALAVVISNTTEVGIVLDEQDDLFASPPTSFPGKLAAVLFERFKMFHGAEDKGLVILPTELIDNNGVTLRDIVITLAERNQLGSDFIDWLKNDNHFCNTLVDRIVPGSLGVAERAQAERQLGYKDRLAIMAEPFCLWAIESSHPRVSEVLSFAVADSRVVITPDIRKFKELKIRLLNGSHTFACGLAILAGFDTVKEAMANRGFLNYVKRLMHREIIPTLVEIGIDKAEAAIFADQVIDRFSNPYLEHQWESISTNFTSKMRARNMATLERRVKAGVGSGADYMALGFAGYLKKGGADPYPLLADWENDRIPWGDFLSSVKKYLAQLQQRPAMDVLDELNRQNESGN